MAKVIVSRREINGVVFERVWKAETITQLTSIETRIDGEKSEILKPLVVGAFDDLNTVLKFIEGTGDTLISTGEYEEA